MRRGGLDQILISRDQQRSRGAVCHGKRATVNISRWREEIREHALMDSRGTTVLAFVSRGHDSVLDGDAFSYFPQRSELDFVDAISPRVPLRQPGFIQTVSEL